MSSVYWLLSDDAIQRRLVREIREARTPLTAYAPKAAAERSAPAPLSIANGVATIRVEGVLTPSPDPMAEFYGEANTTYPDLQESLAAALADSSVREIVWSIDSPGGSVDGYFALLGDIAEARASKPMRVEADNAQSAAYGIAAAAGPITATSRTSSFGSVGIATSGFVQGGLCGTVVDMTNSDAPNKRPNLTTAEGRAVVTAYLDQLAAEFMTSIAAGRGVQVSDVAAGYGRGASMLAQTALETGLIDRIAARKPKGGRGAYALDRTQPVGYGPASMADSAPVTPAQAEPALPEPTEPAEAPAGDPPVEPAPPAGDPPAPANASAVVTITAEQYRELQTLVAERDARASAERSALVGALVAIGAERPATAYANGQLVSRLASEPLADLRARVATLRAQPHVATAPLAPPPVGAPADDGLSEAERARAETLPTAQRGKFIQLCKETRAKSAQGKA